MPVSNNYVLNTCCKQVRIAHALCVGGSLRPALFRCAHMGFAYSC